MDETRELLKALMHAVQTTNAKLDALSDRVELGFEEVKTEIRRTRRQIDSVENDLDRTINRMDKIERH
jgi:predicted  nucleic acid-binding Zn-ribbon protein